MLRRFIRLFLFLFLISGPVFAEPQCEGVLCNSGRNSHNPQQGLFSAFIDPRFNRQAALVQGVGSVFDATVGRFGRWAFQEYRGAWLPGVSPYGAEAALNQIGEALTVEASGMALGGMMSGAAKAGRFAREVLTLGDDLAAGARAGVQEGLTGEFSRVPGWSPPSHTGSAARARVAHGIWSEHYRIVDMPDGTQMVDFKAIEASFPERNAVRMGGGADKFPWATQNPETGLIEIYEGRHRAIATAAGDTTVSVANGAIQGQPGWLRYRYIPYDSPLVQMPVQWGKGRGVYSPTPMREMIQDPMQLRAGRSGNSNDPLNIGNIMRNHQNIDPGGDTLPTMQVVSQPPIIRPEPRGFNWGTLLNSSR